MPNPVSNFLDQFFQALNPIAHPDQARFNAEMALKRQEFYQHTQQFSQEQALREKEFSQRQDYQRLLEQQRQDTLKETANKNASAALDKLSLAGAKYLPTPTGPITQPAALGGQIPQSPIPNMPAMGGGIGQTTTPAAFQGPQNFNEVPKPPELANYPDLQGKSIYLPNEEEKARMTAAGKAAEVTAGQPTWTQKQIDAMNQVHPQLAGVLGATPGGSYDPNNKLLGDLTTHLLTKKQNDTGLNDQWKMTVAAEAKKRGVDPGDLPPEVLGQISKQMADDKERTDQHMLAMMNAHTKQEKDEALAKSGQIFGDAAIEDPKTFIPKDRDTQVAVQQYLQKTYGVGIPSTLGQRASTNEDFARRAIQSVNKVQAMMADPTFTNIIERRQGPGWGRVGNLEQELGKGFNMSQADEARIQEFRAALNYLTFQEGQSLFGGRIPIQLMQQLQTTSPNIKQDKGTVQGALNAVKANAEGSLIAYEKSRFGGKVRPNFYTKNNILPQSEPRISEIPSGEASPLMQNMEDGDEKIIKDSKNKEHVIRRINDDKGSHWYERFNK